MSKKPTAGMNAALKHLEALKALGNQRPSEDHYSAGELAELLGTSETTARTKMKMLIKEGLAESVKQGGNTWFKTL